MRRAAIAAGISAAVMVTAGCTSASRTPEALSSSALGQQDPTPNEFPTKQSVDDAGGVVKNGLVSVTVRAGAVGSHATATIELGRPLGRTDGPYAKEFWGAPVRIDHSGDLAKPVTLAWNIASLSLEQRSSIVLVRWDPARGTWTTTDEPVAIEGNTLSAQVSEFSVVDYVTNGAAAIGQTFGEWTGKRAQAPTCSGKLPSWVKSVVRPDEDFPAAAIRSCVEPDSKPGVLTVRVANNRSYTQLVSLTPGMEWAWVWPGEDDYSPLGRVWDVAHLIVDTKSKAVIPPTKTMAFGIARPTTPGSVQVAMTAQADATTIFSDVIGFTIDNMSVGGFDSPVLNAFVQALYECGGKSLLKKRPGSAQDAATFALEAARGCVSAILGTGSSELSDAVVTAFENALRAEIAKGGSAAESAIKAGRLAHEISARLWYLKLFDIVEYVSNQLADSVVGPTTLTLHLTGTPQALGVWTPSCTDAAKDSNLLYRNLALQDQFASSQKELWQFPGWAKAAAAAIKPLAKCPAAHREAVAKDVSASWADKKAAAVVAKAIHALGPGAGTTLVTVDPWHDGSAADATIIRSSDGDSQCIASEIAPRRDGYRCFADQGLFDPCFASPTKTIDYLCFPASETKPWTLLKGPSKDTGYENTDSPGTTDVFRVKLANGATCARATGAGPKGVPGYPYWVGYCSGGPYGADGKVWRVGEGKTSVIYPLYPGKADGAWTAAIETSDGTVERLPVALAWR
jgi:hypothetical protein